MICSKSLLLILSILIVSTEAGRYRRQGLPTLGGLGELNDLLPCNAFTRCSGKGLCLGTAKQSTCMCFLGWSGDSCDSVANLMDPFNLFSNNKNNQLFPNLFPTASSLNLLNNPFGLDDDALEMCTASDCNGNGVCVGSKKAPLCLCNLGKTGFKCESEISGLLNIDPSAPITFCSPSDCNNKGLCLGTKNSFSCACQIGYTGSRCEKTPVTLCDARDCSSNGLCIGSKDSMTCACYLGYSGERCEKITGTICESSDCNSNGICIGTKNLKSCICAPGYYGSRCESRFTLLPGTEALFCESKDCNGNGICLGNKLLPSCICAPGFTGLRCELEPLCTGALQCSGNGLCVGSLKSYSCTCNLGWTGPNCAQSTLLG
ncbi:hypothetical protein GCK72_013959 [Caenorhabditis remanei]|uniref:EGF-like domain-containing protein n=1 Tax=Caenorhabditis remanei TaxID=31234 RepID=A0A6A5GSI9_CAERE|nr:hypothetical protein GCK72_013959 [Caenorhabditis remanei]KAF1757503.1 hypothetical protein GCK72_013959 [Caenorhabditis remanei]